MIYIILPAYNEEKSIGTLIGSIKKTHFSEPFKIVIVNDGSYDKTSDVLSKLKVKSEKLKVINHKFNRGLGMAIKSGFDYVLSRAKDSDIVVTMDADNTHPTGLITEMIDKTREGFDVVIASRYQDGSKTRGVPFTRQLVSIFAALTFKLFFPIKNVRDYTSGFRVYRVEVIKKLKITESGFSVMADILIRLSKFDLKFCEVPIVLRYDFKKGMSKMKVAETIVKTLRLLVLRKFANV